MQTLGESLVATHRASALTRRQYGQALVEQGQLDEALTVLQDLQADPTCPSDEKEEAGGLVAGYLDAGGRHEPLQARLAHLLLREDRDFHTSQSVEAAFRQVDRLGPDDGETRTVLVAATRYLAAHSPTVRAQGQTFDIAWRLHRGERLYEEISA